jgi:hypothetical protein
MGLRERISEGANTAGRAGAVITGTFASGASEVADKAQGIVTTAIHEIEEAGSTAGQTIQSSSARATQDIQNATNAAGRQIGDTVSKAREDLLKLLEIIGGQVTGIIGGLPDASIGTVNGEKFYTPADGYILAMKAIYEKPPTIEIRTYEPAVIQVFGSMVARSKEEFRRKLLDEFQRQFNLPPLNAEISRAVVADDVAMAAAIFGGVAACMAASVGPILATGVVIFMLLLGIALVIAVIEGYDVENVELGVGEGGRPTIKFSLKKNR